VHPLLVQFLANLQRARDIAALQSALSAQTIPALDLTDLLRASLVLQVSALDALAHEIVHYGMLEAHTGARPRTTAFDAFGVTLADLQRASAGQAGWLEDAIRRAIGWRTYQQPDKISEAIALVSPVKLWDEVGKSLGRPAADIRRQLTAIVDRRNKIAHEADLDPSFPGTRWPISPSDVTDSAVFLEGVGRAICALTL
jgi:hypothetical protein